MRTTILMMCLLLSTRSAQADTEFLDYVDYDIARDLMMQIMFARENCTKYVQLGSEIIAAGGSESEVADAFNNSISGEDFSWLRRHEVGIKAEMIQSFIRLSKAISKSSDQGAQQCDKLRARTHQCPLDSESDSVGDAPNSLSHSLEVAEFKK